MNWDAIGALGEVVGAAAVVISIVYLSIQIRQNTKAAQINAEREIAMYFAKALQDGADTALPGLYVRGSEDLTQLSEEEAAQFAFWNLGFFRFFQYAWDQRREGNLSDSTWETIDLAFKTQLQSPGIRTVWKIRGNTFKQEFRDYVDSVELGAEITSPSEAIQALTSKS